MAESKLTGDVFYPPEEIIRHAHARDWGTMAAAAEKDLEGFWAKEANELHWFEHWEKVLDESKKPFYQWFVGGKTNIAYNCLDRHTATARRNKLALMWEGEKGEFRSFSAKCADLPTSSGVSAYRRGTASRSTWDAYRNCRSPCLHAPASAPSIPWSTEVLPWRRWRNGLMTASPKF